MTDSQISVTSLLQQQEWLRRLARSLVRDAGVDDLVQDTHRAALQSGLGGEASGGGDEKRLRGWLRVIARRRAAEVWRQDSNRAAREVEAAFGRAAEQADVTDELERAEIKQFLSQAVMQLEAPLRDALVLRYYEGYSHQEVALKLGITEALARKHASRACERLREQLDRRSGGDRSLWVSAMAPWTASAPARSASGLGLAAITAVAAAVIGIVLSFFGWRYLGPASETVVSVASVESEEVPLEVALSLPDQAVGGTSVRRDAVAAPAGTPSAAAAAGSRLAFPLPPVHERATLDVLAVWDDTGEPAPFVELYAFGGPDRRTDASGRVRFGNLPAGHGGLGNFMGSHLNVLPKLEPGEIRSLTFRIKVEFSVEGRVVDATGKAVGGAEIQVAASSNASSKTVSRSDAAGRFSLDGLSGGLNLSAVHPSAGVSPCQLVNQSLTLERAKEGRALELVLAGGTGVLAGVVVDENNVPVRGAQVQFAPSAPPSAPHGERVRRSGTVTDEAGRFELDSLRPGLGTWSVRTSFCGLQSGEVTIARGASTQVTLELSAGLVVRGRVLDEVTGMPVVKALVAIGERGDQGRRAAWTDASGAFEIDSVRGRETRLLVDVLRTTVHEQPFVPGTTDAGDLVLRVRPATQAVEGSVMDTNGIPVVGFSVMAVGDRSSSFSARTDALGEFRIEHAPLDASALEVYPPEPHDERLVLRVTGCLPSPGPIDVVVPADRLASGTLVGTVTAGGRPVANFDAELEAMDGSAWLLASGQESGLFRFEGVPVGHHALVVRAEGFVELLRMVDIEAGEPLDLGPVGLERGTTFQLDVAFDSPPTEGTVELYEIRREDDGVQQRLYLGEVEGGVATFGPVLPGRTQLVFDRAGFHRRLEMDVLPGAQTLGSVRFGVPRTTAVSVEYPDLMPRGTDGLEGDVMSFGLTWSLLDAEGQEIRRSYRPRSLSYGRGLTFHGLEEGVEYTLEARDVEGRSGSVRFVGGGAPVLAMH